MNIIFLDDDENRITTFLRAVPKATVIRTANQAINLLKKRISVDYLFLDHDLGGKSFVDSNDNNTGMEVVRWIVKNKPKIYDIIIHSCNPAGAINMMTELQNAGYKVLKIPFMSINFKKLKEVFQP